MDSSKRTTSFNLSSYPLLPKNVDPPEENSINSRLDKKQKIDIKEALGSAGAIDPAHPLHELYEALKEELAPGSLLQEKLLDNFAKRFAKKSKNLASNTFLQTIQNKSNSLHLAGLAQSIDEDSEKSSQRQFAIFVYVTDNYPIPS